ncbi:MAG: hypothetical protein SCARUB_05117, partial [Candidatus Scalindua rubra]
MQENRQEIASWEEVERLVSQFAPPIGDLSSDLIIAVSPSGLVPQRTPWP